MIRFTPWKALYLAWFSKPFYNHVVSSWHGLGLRFLALLLFCLWLVLATKLHFVVANYIDDFLLPVLKAVPEITLQDSKLVMTEDSPVTVKDPRTGKVIMIFDLRENAPLPNKSIDGLFFINNKEIFQYQGKRTEFELKGGWTNKLVTPDILKTLENIRNWSGAAVFVVLFISTLILVTLQVLLYGTIAFALAGIMRRPLSFLQAGRIVTIALVPVLILEFFQRLLGIFLPLWTVVFVLLTTAYVIYGIKSVSVVFNRPEIEQTT